MPEEETPMKRGAATFTLTELAVLAAVIAILAATLPLALTKARENARSATCRNNLKTLGQAFAMYQVDYDEFFPRCETVGHWQTYSNGWGANWQAALGQYYAHPYQILAHEGYLKVGWKDNRNRVANSVLACPSDRAAMLRVQDGGSAAQCRRAHVMGGLTVSYNCNYFLTVTAFTSYRDWSKTMTMPQSTMLSMDSDWWNATWWFQPMGMIRPWGRTEPSYRDNEQAALERHGGRGGNVLWGDLHVSYQNAFAWNSTLAYSRCLPDGSGMYEEYHESQYFYWPLGYGL